MIGQLGKYIEKLPDGTELRAGIASGEILDYAFEVIRASNSLIPCRCALVECSEEPKVQKAYTDYEFKFFQYDRDGGQYKSLSAMDKLLISIHHSTHTCDRNGRVNAWFCAAAPRPQGPHRCLRWP